MHEYSIQDLLNTAIQLAKQASQMINHIRHKGFSVHKKTDSTPVTEADQASEDIIVTALREFFPSIPVIAEEENAAGKKIEVGSEYWLIDPLDGTREFVKNSDFFTVNIGLIRNHKPILGVVALPAFHEIYYGDIHNGAWKIDKHGQKEPIHVSPIPTDGLRILSSRHYAKDPNVQEFLHGLPISFINHMGSAAKIIYVATGQADLHPRFNPTMEWDTAAPQAILEAAGGNIYTLDGNPLSYGKREWKNHHFICCNDSIQTLFNHKKLPIAP